ncbi:MAG: GYF domain-containing protein [Verrucomicrobiota bacterium]
MSEILEYFLVNGENTAGPFSSEQILAKLRKQEISQDDFCCKGGDNEWSTVRDYFQDASIAAPGLTTKTVDISKKSTIKLPLPESRK